MPEYKMGDKVRITNLYPNAYYWGEIGVVVGTPENGLYVVRVRLDGHPFDRFGWLLREEEVERI